MGRTHLLVLVLSLLPYVANSAEIYKSDRAECDFELSGEIFPGDLKKFQADGLFPEDSQEEAWNSPMYGLRLCLNSPGGSMVEGVRISAAIWNTGIISVVAPNAECYSACALVFLGGSWHDRFRAGARYIYADGRLGFHSPALQLPDGDLTDYAAKQIEQAFNAGLEVTGILINLLRVADGGVKPINTYVMSRLLSVKFEDMDVIDTLAEAATANINVLAVNLPSAIEKEHIVNLCDAAFLWNFGEEFNSSFSAAVESSSDTLTLLNYVRSRATSNGTRHFDLLRVGDEIFGLTTGYPEQTSDQAQKVCLVQLPPRPSVWNGNLIPDTEIGRDPEYTDYYYSVLSADMPQTSVTFLSTVWWAEPVITDAVKYYSDISACEKYDVECEKSIKFCDNSGCSSDGIARVQISPVFLNDLIQPF